MVKVIGVKFRNGCRTYFFDPADTNIQAGQGVIVETAKGQEYGDVTMGVTEVPEEQVVAPLKGIVRVATQEDRDLRQRYMAREAEALSLCQKKVEEHELDMSLVRAEYTFNGSKLVFYFTADDRVDFRELVRDLAYLFKTRIELRQIGVRDEAKMLGGIGPCGRCVCCKQFLDDFRPVSIKMAKEQGLSLSPTKISGLCGRLMCCLQYEQCCYEQMHKQMPRVGKEIETPDGMGQVVDNNVITEKTKVKLTAEDGTVDIKEYTYTDLGPGAKDRALEQAAQIPEEEPRQEGAMAFSVGGALKQTRRQPRRTPGETGAREDKLKAANKPGEQKPAAKPGEQKPGGKQGEQKKPKANTRQPGQKQPAVKADKPAAPKADKPPVQPVPPAQQPAAGVPLQSNTVRHNRTHRRSFGPKKPGGSK
ncbi:MAG: hypothetical protein IJR17_06355 [Clostridia bacterium]|nr:hypothetical protein [Clostridia bacterium]